VEAFGDSAFHTVISRTVKFPETSVAGVPITVYAPTSAPAVAYRQLAREVLARVDPGSVEVGHGASGDAPAAPAHPVDGEPGAQQLALG
jgi:MinD-like ATPase involved in chromosome partitioning or flagellar assembly